MIYVYCHTCNKLLAKCCDFRIANAAEKAHREICLKSTITTGKKKYFDKAYPDIVLEGIVK